MARTKAMMMKKHQEVIQKSMFLPSKWRKSAPNKGGIKYPAPFVKYAYRCGVFKRKKVWIALDDYLGFKGVLKRIRMGDIDYVNIAKERIGNMVKRKLKKHLDEYDDQELYWLVTDIKK